MSERASQDMRTTHSGRQAGRQARPHGGDECEMSVSDRRLHGCVAVCLCLLVVGVVWCGRYDCVYPTRTARFGNALVPWGILKLKASRPANMTHTPDRPASCLAGRLLPWPPPHPPSLRDASSSL